MGHFFACDGRAKRFYFGYSFSRYIQQKVTATMCACANRGCGCAKKQTVDAPKEELGLSSAVATSTWLATQLLELIKLGATALPQNITLASIADTLQKLTLENAALLLLLRNRTPTVDVAEEHVKLTFGPDQAYSLAIPVTTENRAELSAMLAKAATQLKTASETSNTMPGQLSLPFSL
jgi:hypothetical protein